MAGILTIAIEESAVRLLVGDGRKLITAASLPLEPGMVKGGLVADKAAVSQKIKDFLAAENLLTKKAKVSLSGLHAIYQISIMPKLAPDLLTEAIWHEAENSMPVPLSEVYLSWQVLDANSNENRICLLAMPRAEVDSVYETLTAAGLQPYFAEARPLAAARSAGKADSVVVNAEADDFDIVIVKNGIPELFRSAGFSQPDLLSQNKAQEIKEELERTIRFFNAGHEDSPVSSDTLVVLGGESGVVESVGSNLEYPSKVFSSPLNGDNATDQTGYMANVGLILEERKTARGSLRFVINSLPQAYLPKPLPVLPMIFGYATILGVVLILLMGLLVNRAMNETTAVQAQLNLAQEKLMARQANPKEIETLQAKLKEVTAARDVPQKALALFEDNRGKINSKLNKVIALLPGNVDLISIKYTGAVRVEGIAPDGETVLSYANNLKASGTFSDVLISYDASGTAGRVSFFLELR